MTISGCQVKSYCLQTSYLSLPSLLWEKAMAPHSSTHSCLENPVDGEAWCAAVHGVAKSWA